MATAHKLKLLVTSLSAGALGYFGWRALVAQVKCYLTYMSVAIVT